MEHSTIARTLLIQNTHRPCSAASTSLHFRLNQTWSTTIEQFVGRCRRHVRRNHAVNFLLHDVHVLFSFDANHYQLQASYRLYTCVPPPVWNMTDVGARQTPWHLHIHHSRLTPVAQLLSSKSLYLFYQSVVAKKHRHIHVHTHIHSHVQIYKYIRTHTNNIYTHTTVATGFFS